jgi:hypothetical protein
VTTARKLAGGLQNNVFLLERGDGSFEPYIGGAKRRPNWLPTTPGSRKLFLGQGFDRWSELPARMRIERVGMTEPPPVPTPEVMMRAMDWAGQFVTGLMNDWPDHPCKYSGGVASSSAAMMRAITTGWILKGSSAATSLIEIS